MKCKQTLEKRGKSCGVNRPFCLFCLVAALPQPMRRPYITAIAAAAGFTPQSHSPIAASRLRCRKSAPTPRAKPKPRPAKPPLPKSKPAKARPKKANPSQHDRPPSPKLQAHRRKPLKKGGAIKAFPPHYPAQNLHHENITYPEHIGHRPAAHAACPCRQNLHLHRQRPCDLHHQAQRQLPRRRFAADRPL